MFGIKEDCARVKSKGTRLDGLIERGTSEKGRSPDVVSTWGHQPDSIDCFVLVPPQLVDDFIERILYGQYSRISLRRQTIFIINGGVLV